MKLVKSIILASVLSVSLLLGACGSSKFSESDAKDYVLAMLDAGYKAEFDGYMKATGDSEEDAIKYFEESFETSADLILGELAINESQSQEFKDSVKKLIAMADYEVVDAKKTEDGDFEVEVVVKPSTVFSNLEENLMSLMWEKMGGMSEDELSSLTEDDANKIAVDIMIELFNDLSENPTYGEPESVTIHLSQSKDGEWEIPAEDMQALDSKTFEY